MMVDMFVGKNGPLPRFERTKERMRVLGAAGCPLFDEAIDSSDEMGAFTLEVALRGMRREEFRRGRRIAAQGLVVGQDQRLYEPAEDAGRKGCTFGVDAARRHLHARRTVRQGLDKGHAAPPPLTVRMEAHDSLLYVFRQSEVKEIFHRRYCPPRGIVASGYNNFSIMRGRACFLILPGCYPSRSFEASFGREYAGV